MGLRSKDIQLAVPLVRTTLTAAAFEQLIAYVVKGSWKSGSRIPPERELCQQLGIARTSLREALKAMELIGLLESRVGDGTFVCARSEFLSRPLLWALTGTDHMELQDITEARSLIERDLAGLAAERAIRSEIAEIKQTVYDMRRAIKDGQSIIEADMAFHLSVARAAHNDVLHNAVQLLRNLLRHWISLKLRIPNIPHRVLSEHEIIYDAIKSRDREAAREAMWQHLQNTARLLTQIVESDSRTKNTRSTAVRTTKARGKGLR